MNKTIPKRKNITLPDTVLNKLNGGEIILRKGRGFLSTKIVEFLNEDLNYSHAGILIKSKNKFIVIHSLSNEVSNIDGVQAEYLNKFLLDVADSSICILRAKTSKKQQLQIQQEALRYLELQIPFDHHFNFDSKNEIYCSELVHDILLNVLKKETFPPENVWGFKVLKFSPFFDTTNYKTLFELKHKLQK